MEMIITLPEKQETRTERLDMDYDEKKKDRKFLIKKIHETDEEISVCKKRLEGLVRIRSAYSIQLAAFGPEE